MAEQAANYISLDVQERFRNQAVNVWIAASAVVAVWVAFIVAAPLISIAGISGSSPIYTFFSYICHQIPERSLHLAGHQLAVCSRCFGVYMGLLGGMLLYPLWRPVGEIEPIPRFWLFLALVPISIDWSLTLFGIWENTHASRFITGLILGGACATFIVPALVEIVRNFSYRSSRAR
jgi:uncharacterized membrane protein